MTIYGSMTMKEHHLLVATDDIENELFSRINLKKKNYKCINKYIIYMINIFYDTFVDIIVL